MNFFKYVKYISILLLLSFISACSNNKQSISNINKLQNDLDAYKYSSYVRANLKPEVLTSTEKQVRTNSSISNKNSKRMILAKNQLRGSKQQSINKIANTINNNGLYKSTKRGNEKSLVSFAGLDNVIALALQNNLDIKSAKEQVSASLTKYDQVGFLEDMLSQYAAFTQTKKPVQFPFPGLMSLKSSVIDQSIETSRLRLKQKIQDVITQTRLAYYELQFADAEMDLVKRDIRLLKSLKQELQNNYESNTGDLDDVLQVDITIATRQNNLQTIRNKRESQQARLNALLNIPSSLVMSNLDKIKYQTAVLSFAKESFIKQAQSNRVEIAILESELAMMQKVIQLSQKRFYPNLDAGFSRFKDGKFSTKAKIKANPVFAKNDAYLTETRAKVGALKSKIAALKTKTVDDVQQYVSQHQSAKKSRALLQNTIIPKARASLAVSNSMYETGVTNYAKVIKSQEMIVKYRIQSLNALKNMNMNKAKLERLIANNQMFGLQKDNNRGGKNLTESEKQAALKLFKVKPN